MSDEETKIDNLVDAIPGYSEPPENTMVIWHRCKRPKFSYSRLRNELSWMAEEEIVERIGCAQGAQFYRCIDI